MSITRHEKSYEFGEEHEWERDNTEIEEIIESETLEDRRKDMTFHDPLRSSFSPILILEWREIDPNKGNL